MDDEPPIMTKKTPASWLKELSGIGIGAVAILYVCGYLAHTVYYRLLGVDVGAQPLTYLTISGDYLVSIFISIPQLFSLFGEYSHKLIEDRLWLSVLLWFSSLFCILLLKKKPQSRTLKILVCVFIGCACLSIISSELKVLRVQNVLQPFSPIELQSGGKAIAESSKTLRERVPVIRDYYEEHEKLGINMLGFNEWKRWFDPLNPNARQERNNSYLALLLLNSIFLIVAIIAIWLRGVGIYATIITTEALLCVLALLLLFPCVYATLGKVMSFPVAILRLKAEDDATDGSSNSSSEVKSQMNASMSQNLKPKELITHPVFIIFKDDSELLVYDRLNLFQLKRMPRSRVLSINQLHNSSPFENCQLENGALSLCESLWIEDSTPIPDF